MFGIKLKVLRINMIIIEWQSMHFNGISAKLIKKDISVNLRMYYFDTESIWTADKADSRIW